MSGALAGTDNFAELVESGLTGKAIARRLGVDLGDVYRMVARRGLRLHHRRKPAIIAALREREQTAAEVARVTGAGIQSTHVRLRQLAREGVVERTERVRVPWAFRPAYRWRLAEAGAQL